MKSVIVIFIVSPPLDATDNLLNILLLPYNIYIVRNRNGITAENLSAILKRNDIKKSEAYESGFLEGTVPMYDAYMDLKNSIIRSRKED